MKRLATICATGFLALLAPMAHAACGGLKQTHYIDLYYDGYFPTKTYLCQGDDVYFVNKSGYWMYFYWESAKATRKNSSGQICADTDPVCEGETYENVSDYYSGWMASNAVVGPVTVRGHTGDDLWRAYRWNGSSTVRASYGGKVYKNVTAPYSY